MLAALDGLMGAADWVRAWSPPSITPPRR